ncbi:hypothetical protein C8R44DRAFT_384173 [Mycena epipterygia]|nr:hypothetical protein C8R44DRAFT_384173 [Mycena epipterygia]
MYTNKFERSPSTPTASAGSSSLASDKNRAATTAFALSTGTQIAIGTGSTVGAIAFIAALTLFGRHQGPGRRARRSGSGGQEGPVVRWVAWSRTTRRHSAWTASRCTRTTTSASSTLMGNTAGRRARKTRGMPSTTSPRAAFMGGASADPRHSSSQPSSFGMDSLATPADNEQHVEYQQQYDPYTPLVVAAVVVQHGQPSRGQPAARRLPAAALRPVHAVRGQRAQSAWERACRV